MSLVEQTLFPYFFESPPFGLDICVVISNVRIVHIRPESYTVAHLLPLVAVFPNAFLTFFDEWLNAVFLDLGLAAYAELFFDLKLNGKSVGIPAALTKNVIALHNTVTENKVLDGSCLNVADMGLAVCRGRSLNPSKSGISLSQFYTFSENVVLLPEVKNFHFSVHEVEIRGHLLIQHSNSSVQIFSHIIQSLPPASMVFLRLYHDPAGTFRKYKKGSSS